MKPSAKIRAGAMVLASACVLAAGGPANAVTILKFTVSGAVTTMGRAIDASGDVAGNWYDASEVSHGFLRTAGGTITKFDPSGSTGTTVYAMNGSETIVGSFTDSGGTHGFMRAAGGTITVYDAPGSDAYTEILSINDSGDFVGTYAATDGNQYGFVVVNGTFTSFQAKTARYTTASAIDATGSIAGEATENNGAMHAFLRAPGGTLGFFAVPGANEPQVKAINATKSVAGTSYVYPTSNTGHGYIRLANGTFETFQVVAGYETQLWGLNAGNVACGTYYSSSGGYYSYIRNANGTIVSFDVAKSGASNCLALNDSGVATGYYYDSNDIGHGYIRTP